MLRELRRRHARRTGGAELTYRQLAAATGWSHGIIGEYLGGKVLPPTDRFDALIRLLGATPAEQGALATARDRVEERRHDRPPASAAQWSPRQLPADVPGFTGRAAQLRELDALLEEPAASPVCVLSGSPGVGKTALAIHWGHQVASRFPDGQLYLDLRGYDPEQPLPPAAALGVFLRALGLDAALLPGGTEELSARYRTLLADRRMLVVLDNAHAVDQVRPLLPGAGSSLVLVTSRDDLAGLVAREGARRIPLEVLTAAEAQTLLRTLIGARAAADPDAAQALAQRCARMPLALRVAAEIATMHPDLTLADLLDELGDERRRLDVLDAAGDHRSAARAVFSWSFRRLTTAAAHAFGLLGLHPGPEFDVAAVAALTGADRAAARTVLEELRRAHLVEVTAPGRFRMHDLLRAYAAEQAEASTLGAERWLAQSRLLSYYVDTAVRAAHTLYPHDRLPADPLEDALGWLDRERATLVAVAEHAARRGWPQHSLQLSAALWRYLEVGGHHQEALALHTSAVAVAAGSGPERATALANLAGVHWWLGSYQDARECYARARDQFREAGDSDGEARAVARLGVVHERLGDYGAAAGLLGEALDLYRATGNRHGEGSQLLNLGGLYRRMGRYEESAQLQQRAARLFAELGDRRLEGYALGNLGVAYGLLGRETEALEHLRVALQHCRDSADPGGEGSALAAVGAVTLRLGRYPEAVESLHRALAISREVADCGVETETLNTLGETLRAMGQPAAALARHQAALTMSRQTGDRYEQARALDGMARVHAVLGEPATARERVREALELYRALGVPEAEETRAFSKELR